eukprot:TRINITY_DN33505_c0_g1_i1.p1 TRINITY_DN33505_c0_g1~~TRINITY_DN33505_c0_g1_i1.p1  ORF type:complete len:119 (+),score=23.92 TRINITY_DN33505_c0_g1_i1:164-520(+)
MEADASMKGGAYILEERKITKAFKWSEEQTEQSINVLEALALLEGTRDWAKKGSKEEKLMIKTDSQLLYFALKNRKATGIRFNSICREIVRNLGGYEWEVEWVSSEEQLADAPSRYFL